MTDLNWEATYAIAKRLQSRHPGVDLREVSLEMIFKWTLALPEFEDDPEVVNDSILMAIYQEWYEESDPL